MKNTQSKIKPIKLGKPSAAKTSVLGVKIVWKTLGHKK